MDKSAKQKPCCASLTGLRKLNSLHKLNISSLASQPHYAKDIFKKYKLPIASVANYLGCSYTHARMMLCGVSPVSEVYERKLQELVDALEAQEVN